MCSHDRPESSSSNPRVGIIKIHLIETVEKLGAKLRIDAFLDFETLKKSHVKASERWTIISSPKQLWPGGSVARGAVDAGDFTAHGTNVCAELSAVMNGIE